MEDCKSRFSFKSLSDVQVVCKFNYFNTETDLKIRYLVFYPELEEPNLDTIDDPIKYEPKYRYFPSGIINLSMQIVANYIS
jgi:hypothetical protein